MIRKIKQWLLNRFLPMWAKETVLAENKKLQQELAKLREDLNRKEAYIAGIATGLKAVRRITINAGEGKK